MILVKNWDIINLELILDDLLVRKEALLDYNTADFTRGVKTGLFSKELTHNFDQNLEITSWFIFGQNAP